MKDSGKHVKCLCIKAAESKMGITLKKAEKVEQHVTEEASGH